MLALQFLKGWDSGELRAAARLPEIEILRGDASSKFVFEMTETEVDAVRQKHNENIRNARTLVASGAYRLLVLDEILSAWNLNVVDQDEVLALLREKPDDLEVVMTGRDPSPALMELADYISEVRKVRHPYDAGIDARRYIEF